MNWFGVPEHPSEWPKSPELAQRKRRFDPSDTAQCGVRGPILKEMRVENLHLELLSG